MIFKEKRKSRQPPRKQAQTQDHHGTVKGQKVVGDSKPSKGQLEQIQYAEDKASSYMEGDDQTIQQENEVMDSSSEEEEEEEEKLEEDENENEGHSKEFNPEVDLKSSLSAQLPNNTTYIPPQLQNKSQDLTLSRQVQGLLNKVTPSNLSSITNCFLHLYEHHPRAIVTTTFISAILNYLTDPTKGLVLDLFVMCYAGLIAATSKAGVGMELAADGIQTFVQRFVHEHTVEQQITPKEASTLVTDMADQDPEEENKKILNLCTVLGYLYTFNIIAPTLIYDIIRMAIKDLTSIDVSILLRLLRLCGPKLRRDDPLALKEIILLVTKRQSKLVEAGHVLSVRTKFMMESLLDLKNNKVKAQRKGMAQGETEEAKLVKTVELLGQKTAFEPLGVTLEDIRNVGNKGKWWLVGSAWAGTETSASSISTASQSAILTSTNAKLLNLAKRLGMNTDVRRSIFLTLLTSDDYLEAYDKLLKLGLKDKQEREMVRVILTCVGNEPSYNPYYGILSQRLILHSHSHIVTFQFALWDMLKQMEDEGEEDDSDGNAQTALTKRQDDRKQNNTAELYAHLVHSASCPLSIIKVDPLMFYRCTLQK